MVKIDQYLVQATDRKSKIKLSGLMAMLEKFDIQIVLKGIETQHLHDQYQNDYEQEYNATLSQGYFYDKPSPQVLFNMRKIEVKQD